MSRDIPTQLGSLTNMKGWFYLSSNFLSYEVPTELGKMDRLTENGVTTERRCGGSSYSRTS